MKFKTTEKHEELRMKIRNFAEEKIKPKAFSQGNSNFKECIIQIIRLK